MKKIIFLLSITSTLFSKAQTQFDYMGGIEVWANMTGCFYIDLNTGNTNTGENDIKFVHGNGEIYFDAVAGDSLRLPTLVPPALVGRKLWADCNVYQNNFNLNRVYILSANRNLSIGSHVLPFKYNDLYNYIVINVEDNMHISIRGWVFNIPQELYECYILTD